jgi:hypothetical protein
MNYERLPADGAPAKANASFPMQAAFQALLRHDTKEEKK